MMLLFLFLLKVGFVMSVMRARILWRLVGAGAVAAMLAACSGARVEEDIPREVPGSPGVYTSSTAARNSNEIGSLFGDGGLGFGGNRGAGAGGGGIGVNALLWQATLDTIAFMPLVQADPFGGVILTDWYSADNAPSERLKLNIFILGQELRADAVRVSMFRQRRTGPDSWEDVAVQPQSPVGVENAILTRARLLRRERAGAR
jgi:hypothetical protein